eukprot:1987328-Prymnesium_polylepis.2
MSSSLWTTSARSCGASARDVASGPFTAVDGVDGSLSTIKHGEPAGCKGSDTDGTGSATLFFTGVVWSEIVVSWASSEAASFSTCRAAAISRASRCSVFSLVGTHACPGGPFSRGIGPDSAGGASLSACNLGAGFAFPPLVALG